MRNAGLPLADRQPPDDPASTPMVVRITGLPAQATPPALTPPPTSAGDTYADAIKRDTIKKENDAKLRAYQQVLAQAYAALDRAETRRQADALRRLKLQVDNVAT